MWAAKYQAEISGFDGWSAEAIMGARFFFLIDCTYKYPQRDFLIFILQLRRYLAPPTYALNSLQSYLCIILCDTSGGGRRTFFTTSKPLPIQL